jgi:hypothetical protein
MYFPELIGKKVRFKMAIDEYKSFYGEGFYEGTIVKNGCKNYIEARTTEDEEEFMNYGYDFFELHEVDYEIIE